MTRRTLGSGVAVALALVLALQLYSAPKTIQVGQPATPAPGFEGGIPAEYGDLVAVDGGYLFFVDGDGTIRRVGLTQDGSVIGPVIVVPRGIK